MLRTRVCCGLLLAVVGGGCGGTPEVASGPQGLFQIHCAKCHAQAGQPGGPDVGGSRGRNLAKVGTEPGKTVDYLAEYIADPKSKIPDAKMPGFGAKMTKDEIRSLADYISKLK